MSAGSGKRTPPKKMAHVGPNMTPMVDVVMCILIFFMLGSTFAVPELFLTSNMPAIDKQGLGTEQTNQKLPPIRITINMSHDEAGNTWVSAFDSIPLKMYSVDDHDQADNEKILGFFDTKKPSISDDAQIIIKPASNVPYQDVITIYDYCAQAKFKQVAFAAAH